MSQDFAFILQGPYHPAHISMIPELKKHGLVFLSCYVPDLNKVIDANLYDAIIPNEVIDTKKNNIYNFNNVYNQIRTTRNALKLINTRYTVKFRSDSFYSGIPYLVESIKNNVNKLSVSSLNINPVWPYQFSDHIMASSTDNLKGMIDEAESIVLNKNFIYESTDTRLCPEVLFFVSWMKSKNIKGDNFAFEYFLSSPPSSHPRMEYTDGTIKVTVYKNYLDTVQNNVNILNIDKMSPFYAKSNTLNCSFSDPHDCQIKDIETYRSEFLKHYSSFFQ